MATNNCPLTTPQCGTPVVWPSWVQANSTRQVGCNNGLAATQAPPYSIAAGGITNIRNVMYTATTDCGALVGTTPDCPSTDAADACVFGSFIDPVNCNTSGNILWPCTAQAKYCSKIGFDGAFREPCCMAALGGSTTSYTNANTGAVHAYPTAELACDPSWCPLDPDGACERVFSETCAGSVSYGGAWVSALLGDPTSPCATWYAAARAGQAPFTRWAVIDGIIERYCSLNPHDTASCGCFLYGGGAGSDGSVCNAPPGTPCFLWTRDTDGTPRPVRTIDAATSNTVNLTDYACVAPQCRGNVLLPSDVWAMQYNDRCPPVCLQMVSDATVILNGDTVDGGIYVDTTTLQCRGALASTTQAAPQLLPTPGTVSLVWPHYVDCAAPPCCPRGSDDCVVTVPLYYALAPSSADLLYSVSISPPLPPGVTVQNGNATTGTLSNAAAGALDLTLAVDGKAVTLGAWASTVTVRDTRPQYAGAVASTVFQLTVANTTAPPPPPPPSGPNPGTGPTIIYADTPYPWLPYVLYALAALAALLFVRQLVLWRQRAVVRRTLGAVPTPVTPVAPAVPYYPYPYPYTYPTFS